jgi:hypothetical protein
MAACPGAWIWSRRSVSVVEDLLPLVVGFLLTGVLGGLLGTHFQKRFWEHQNEARLREEEQRRAGDVCQTLSTLLDKRLYRMVRLAQAVRRYAEGSATEDDLEKYFYDYDSILYEWNDRLNVNLALAGSYFGQSARDYLDFRVYETCKRAGNHLEEAYRQVRKEPERKADLGELLAELTELNDQAYEFCLFMNTQLREGRVGRRALEPVQTPTLPVSGRAE